MVFYIQRFAAGMRAEPGDALTGVESSGRRPIGTQDAPAFSLELQRSLPQR